MENTTQVRSQEEIELALIAARFGAQSKLFSPAARNGFAQAQAFLQWVLGGKDEAIESMVTMVDRTLDKRPACQSKRFKDIIREPINASRE